MNDKMSDSVLTCQVRLPEAPVAGEAKPLQVGDIWSLDCESSTPISFESTAQIVFADEKDKLNLKILKVKEGLEFDVVSYKAGEFKDQTFLISDGVASVKVAPLNWTIESVLTQESKPFPLFKVEKLSYPVGLWLAFVAVVLLLFFVFWRWRKKRLERQKLIESVLGVGHEGKKFREIVKQQNKEAYSQLARDLRQIQKNMQSFQPRPALDIWSSLEKAYRLYLMRELLTPALDWSSAQILKDIKKYHYKVYEATGSSILKVLIEFDRARGREVSPQDCEQIFELMKLSCDKIYQTRVK